MNINKFTQLKNWLRFDVVVILIIILLTAWFTVALVLDNNTIFLPGKTSDGHALFEASRPVDPEFDAKAPHTWKRCVVKALPHC